MKRARTCPNTLLSGFSRQTICDSLSFRTMSALETAADAIESDGAQGYLRYLSADRLADLINEFLPPEVQSVIYARMVSELADHFEDKGLQPRRVSEHLVDTAAYKSLLKLYAVRDKLLDASDEQLDNLLAKSAYTSVADLDGYIADKVQDALVIREMDKSEYLEVAA